MGQKVHPYGFRLGFTKPWKSRWFAERDYDKQLHEDVKLKSELKEKLKSALSADNVAQTMAAPATAIVGSDHAFYEQLPRLYKESPEAKSWFEGKPEVIAATAFRNASLQGAYLIIAARALGLDCGPMSGFHNATVDKLFFAGTEVKSNFLINIGYGNPEIIRPREYRYTFEEACRIE